MIDKETSRSVLFLGMDYKRSKGGIPDVERYYGQFFDPYQFIGTSVDGSKLKKSVFAALGLAKLTWRLAFDRKIKIIHVHGCSDNSFWRKRLFIRLAKLYGKKVVYHMHGGGFIKFSLNHKEAVQDLLDKCDVLAVLSPSWQRFFHENFRPPRMAIVPNGIMPPSTVAVEPHEGTRMLFLGMINANKGVYDLIEAVAKRQDNYRGRLVIDICGVGEVEEMQKRAKEAGVNDIIRYGGWVAGEEKARKLAECDAFILPSHFEGVPVCILEAMSYGKPVIATRVGGIPDIITDGENGLLVPPSDPEALAAAIDRALADPSAMRSMGEASLSRISAHMPSKVASSLEVIYRSLL